jgi:23S rRNA (guanosine2251-2'-O)-methyltransferase
MKGSVAGRLVLGLQPVRECLRVHGHAVLEVALASGDSPKLAALERFALDRGVGSVVRLPRAELDRRAQGGQHQGVMALAPELALQDWAQVVRRPDLIAMALDRIQDPQNFGAVVRSAVATGGAALLWGEHASAPLTPATFRASAGAIEHATLCRVASLKDGLRAASEAGAQVIGLHAGGTDLLSSIDLRGPTVIVLGNEGDGLQPAVRRCCTRLASLLRTRSIDSLNASVAAAIALYETVQQRIAAPPEAAPSDPLNSF